MSVEREEGLIPGVCNHPHAACPAADLLGGEDVARIAIAAGFSGEALITAVALAKAESTWDRCCFSATNDVGIWQINKVHWPNFGGRDNLYDANVNARAAFSISSSGTNFNPWSAFKNGAYQRYLPEAKAAVDAVLHP